MNTFKLTCVAAIICGVLSGNAVAAGKKTAISEEEDKLKQSNLSIDGINTVAQPELIIRSDNEGKIRDTLRTESDIDTMRIQNAENKATFASKRREVIVEEFINDNVPAHVIAMGDNAINAYIMENFSSDAGAAVTDKPHTLWESSSNILSAPSQPPVAWSPEVTTIESNSNIADMVVTPTELSASSNEGGDKVIVTDEDQKKALALFDMDQKDLDALFDGNFAAGNDAPKAEEKAPEPPTSNVVMSQIEIKQLVIIGNVKYIDAKLTFEVLRNGQSRQVVVHKDGLKPGTIFNVEKERFELMAIDENQVVFENIDKQKTFTQDVS
ncbi:MAG: hypothetical protein CBC55_02925 [Gammaproteobacteria bacterium TMED95]|nr:MAG: hypothetical protein CBC55_02925 [Gammaproteobacteria bacterium TMED95]|tara:strand:+ start:26174 stop:27151 length:978 start_codon:yes stop_codon:yes gene_type:complete